jgi:murein DD-endopeptidase MepM/ murein hydrolase activator NlpD
MRKYFVLAFLVILAGCSSTKIVVHKESTKKILAQTKAKLEKKYNIKNAEVILAYDLTGSASTHLTNNHYPNIINDSKYNKQFLKSANNFNKSVIEQNAKLKLEQLRQLTSKLAKNNIHFKYKIPKSSSGTNYFKQLVKVHNKLGKSLPIMLPASNPCLTSNYGMRKHPIKKQQKFHYGIDLCSTKHLIFTAAEGAVTSIMRNKNGYGNSVTINHSNGIKTFYAHLDRIFVSPNQKVIQGELIGTEGQTGNVTGRHLHFETMYKDKKVNPIIFISSQL